MYRHGSWWRAGLYSFLIKCEFVDNPVYRIYTIDIKNVRDSAVESIKNQAGGKKMKCPYCGNIDTRVIDSRPADDGTTIRRRRSCDACNKRFTTYEKVETIPLIVIKKDKNRETYDRSKIESGVIKSCHKRPVSAEAVTKCIDDIENTIFNMEVREIESTTIGEIVMDKIKDLDQVAYVRFASVYREFKDVNTFMDELGKLLTSNSEKR